jgi:ATP-dependent helicase YprA (DUF1998 family)
MSAQPLFQSSQVAGHPHRGFQELLAPGKFEVIDSIDQQQCDAAILGSIPVQIGFQDWHQFFGRMRRRNNQPLIGNHAVQFVTTDCDFSALFAALAC